jgi:hypothetical protein
MSDKFPDRGDFSIPSALFDEHEWMVDYLIDGPIGLDCALIYPPSDQECPNCLFDPSTGSSAGIYKTSGPMPFPNHTVCPWCGGEGRRIEPVTEPIRLRVYWGGMEVNAAVKQFKQLVDTKFIDNPTGLIFVIGYMYDLPKFVRSDGVIINNQITMQELRCNRMGEPVPWGFKKNRYFAAMLERQ